MFPRFPIKIRVALLAGLFAISRLASAEVVIDDPFTAPQLAKRDLSPARGTWSIANGVATCTQDDALYAKNKDHGPILWYDAQFTDAKVKFGFRPQGTRSFVFTLNNEKGHVFRFVVAEGGLSVRTWPEQGAKAKAVSLLAPKPGTPALKDGEWVDAELKFAGSTCTLRLGDFQQTFEHAAIANTKTKLGLGFSFGTLTLRAVAVEKQ
jgi:hypothetical protein